MHKKILVLNNQQIKRLITLPEVLKTVEKAFYSYGQHCVQMPAKIYLHLNKYQGDFRAMPAYIEGLETVGIKWVNVHPRNRRFGMPAVMATILLNDPKTGFPLSIMAGTYLTNVRTAAAGAVAANYLARKDSSKIGMVGCGVQARMQLIFLNLLFKIKKVYVWGKKSTDTYAFVKDMQFLGCEIKITKNIIDCVTHADIVVTTTPSTRPIVDSLWIKSGTHINAIGADAPGKEELDPLILKRSKIVIDDWTQASHSGEINVPLSRKIISQKNIFATLGDIVVGRKKGRTTSEEITLFDSTGLAIQDIAVANLAYKKACKNKVGKWIEII